MNVILIILCICLLILFLFTIGKLIIAKKQIRNFIKQTNALKNNDYKKPITLESFDKDMVELANALNDHINIQKEIYEKYLENERKLKEIISGISHDFRTPLTAANGYLQMIEKSKQLSGVEYEYLKIAIQKTNYLKTLSDDFFELALIESGKDNIESESVNITRLMTECVLGQYYRIEAEKLSVDIDISEKPVFIIGNSHILNRIFENLLSNAIKYAKNKISVKITTKNEIAEIIVSNDVYDKSSIDISSVFNPFYRGNIRTKEGSGIGLFVVKNLSDKLGINIKADFDSNDYFVITLLCRLA
ncbi:MAG: HAMP domain-containing sensor histidine kinase [Clostridia bacterium]|nr:HAMP domain-containing sensor histidine kinase [Clostridia bacterium]